MLDVDLFLCLLNYTQERLEDNQCKIQKSMVRVGRVDVVKIGDAIF